MKFYDMNKCLCKELCCEFEKFKCDPKAETFHGIKELVETMVGLQELEAAGAMRRYLEDEHGYDSHTGEFREMMYPRYGIYNALTPPTYTNPNPAYQRSMPAGDRRKMDGREYGRGYDDDERMGNRDMNGDRDYRGVYNMAHMDGKEMPKKLTEREKQEWLDSMDNSDGTKGETFSKEQASAIAKKVGANFDNYSESDFALALNSVYSDFCEALNKVDPKLAENPMTFGQMAIAWLEDEDSYPPEERLARYWKYMVKH